MGFKEKLRKIAMGPEAYSEFCQQRKEMEESIAGLESIVAEYKKEVSGLSLGGKVAHYIGGFFRFIDDYDDISMFEIKGILKYYKKKHKKMYG